MKKGLLTEMFKNTFKNNVWFCFRKFSLSDCGYNTMAKDINSENTYILNFY